MKKKVMTKWEAIVILIVGGFVGTVFTFGTRYWNAPVPYEDTIPLRGAYSRWEARDRAGQTGQILLFFSDREPLSIDSACNDAALRNRLDSLVPGEILSARVHPHSDTILELTAGSDVLLSFAPTMEKLETGADFFMLLGLCLYGAALYALWALGKGAVL